MSELQRVFIYCLKENVTEGRFRKAFESLENVDDDQFIDWSGSEPGAPLFTGLEPFSVMIGGEEFYFEATTSPTDTPYMEVPFPAHLEILTIGFDHHLDIDFGTETELLSDIARKFFTGMEGMIGLVIHDLIFDEISSYEEIQALTSEFLWLGRDIAALVGPSVLAQLGPLLEFEGGLEIRLGAKDVGEHYDWGRAKEVIGEIWRRAIILHGEDHQRTG